MNVPNLNDEQLAKARAQLDHAKNPNHDWLMAAVRDLHLADIKGRLSFEILVEPVKKYVRKQLRDGADDPPFHTTAKEIRRAMRSLGKSPKR